MSLIQKEIADFTVQCYQNNAFRAVSKADGLLPGSVPQSDFCGSV